MASISQSPSYLIRTPHSYCFRMIVPKDVQSMVGKTELRYSLRTGYLSVAKTKSRLMAGRVQKLIQELRRDNSRFMKLSNEQIRKMVTKYLERAKANMDEPFGPDCGNRPFDDEASLAGYIRELDDVKSDIRVEMTTGKYWRVKEQAIQLLKESGANVDHLDENNASFAKLCEGLLSAELRGLDYHRERLSGTASVDLEQAFDGVMGKGVPVVQSISEPEEEPSILLSELWKQYQAEYRKAGRWSPSTIKKYQPQIRTLLQVVGDIPINTISSPKMREYRQILDNLPPNFSKKWYKDLTGIKPKDLKGKFDKHLDISTILGYMDLASSLFDYAVDSEYISKNPIPKGIIPHKKVRAKDRRHAFSDPEDLGRIFAEELFLKWSNDKPERFWVPLLLLYTGCRLEEACQINVGDVLRVEGIWSIKFSGATTALEVEDGKKRGENKKLKTGASPRTIPLHPFLVEELRFPRYVQLQQEAGKGMVFHQLIPIKERTGVFSHYLSKQGNYYIKRNVKVEDDIKKLYSLRHNVATHLQNQMVSEWMIEELEGRAGKTETSKTYAKGFRAPVIYKEAILKLDFKVNLSHLKASKWVPKDTTTPE